MRKIVILLILLAALFISSSQSYEQQSIIPMLQKWLPNKPLEGALSILSIPYWGITVSVEERGYYYFVEFLLRKSAHFFIFALIAAFVYSILPKKSSRFIIATLIALLIAIGDEYHQSLTGGRTPSTQDILLDMSGAITALILIRILSSLKNKKRKRKKSRK